MVSFRAEHTINSCLNAFPFILHTIAIVPIAPTELPEACLTEHPCDFSIGVFGKYLFQKSVLMHEQFAPVSTIAVTVEFNVSFTVRDIISICFLLSKVFTVYSIRSWSASHSSLFALSVSYSSELEDKRSKYFTRSDPSELTEVSSGRLVSEVSFSLSLLYGLSFCTTLTCFPDFT